MLRLSTRPYRIRVAIGTAVLVVVAVVAPVALDVDTAWAASNVGCGHPDVTMAAKPTLGVPDKHGSPRHATLKIRSHKTTQELTCSSSFTVLKNGVERTIEQASLKVTLKRATNECASLTAPGVGVPWSGSAVFKYFDEHGRRVATSRRAGTFYVLDSATTFEGPGLIRISATPTSTAISGPFAGTFLELNVTYDPPSLSPYTTCQFGGWHELPTPQFTYWQEA